jgi:hypothetical protein
MKRQLHQSGLAQLSKCGIAFSNKYLLRMSEPRSVAMVTGSAVDRAVTADQQSKISTGSLLPVDAVRDIARDALVDEWRNGSEVRLNQTEAWKNQHDVMVTAEDADEGWAPGQGDAIDAAVALAEFHHKEIGPGIEPTHVQRLWTLDIAGIDNMQLAGAIDVQEGLTRLRDTKTSGKSPSKDLAEKSLQLTMYALAVKAHDGAYPQEVQLDYVVRTPKRKDMKLVTLTSTRNESDMPHLIARIENAAQVMDSGMFVPAPLDSWVCTPKFCGFWNTCPYAARRVSVAVNGTK